MLIKIGDAFVDPHEIAMICDGSGAPFEASPHICVTLRHGCGTWIHATMDEAEAALIDAGVIEDPYEDAVPTLTDDELGILRALHEEGFEWLARDADGKLFAFAKEPTRDGPYWYDTPGSSPPKRIPEGFDFIDSDAGKWSIPWLLAE